MEISFEKQVQGEDGLIFVKCEENEATHKVINYPESRYEMGQERPGRRFKL